MLQMTLLLIAALFSSPAHASDCPPEPAPELSMWEQADASFASWVVGPMAKVMFYDLVFWDNELPAGEGINKVVDGRCAGDPQREAVSYDEDKGYTFRDVNSADSDEVVLQLAQPKEMQGWTLIQNRDGSFSAEVEENRYGREFLPAFPFEIESQIEQTPELERGEGALPAEVVFVPEQVVHLPDYQLPVVVGSAVLLDGAVWTVGEVVEDTLTLHGGTHTEKLRLPNKAQIGLPAVVAWLVFGAVFFTFRMSFINLRGLGHAVKVTAGSYDHPDDTGEVTHFQALSAALSATVGLGNIAGVAVAVGTGGPGAIFWMVVAGFLGMSSKFAECTLGQMYRVVDAKGQVSGGPMRYLHAGLAEMGLGGLGKGLAVVFAVMCIGGSLGGGNMFQANQSYEAVADVVPLFGPKSEGVVVLQREDTAGPSFVPMGTKVTTVEGITFRIQRDVLLDEGVASLEVPVRAASSGLKGNVEAGAITLGADSISAAGITSISNPGAMSGGEEPRAWLYGILLAIAVAVVIIGGIKSIGKVAGLIVPVMCGVYVAAAVVILVMNAGAVPAAFGTIFDSAFTLEAGIGGLIGTLITGFRRAAFSNEAGIGSASIAHSAASTEEPVREGIVALLEPFIDTIIVCTMTGLVVVITGAYEVYPDEGVLMTSAAFGSVISWFPLVLSFAVVLFAFSTMISWSYYGERCWTYLFGEGSSLIYKVIFLFAVFAGSIFHLGSVLDFSDLMVLGMAFPNILGVVILSGKVRARLDDYWGRLKSGEMQTTV